MIQGVRYNIRTLLGVYLNDCLPNNLWSYFDMGLHEIPTAFIAFSFHFLGWNSEMVEWWDLTIILSTVRFHFSRWDSTFKSDISHQVVIQDHHECYTNAKYGYKYIAKYKYE